MPWKTASKTADDMLILVICVSQIFTLAFAQLQCAPGKFGRACNRDCHCPEVNCSVDGYCKDKCSRGYFGPSCQTEDNLVKFSKGQEQKWMVDGEDKTCNNDTNDREKVLEFTTKFSASFLRMTVSNASILESFDIRLVDDTQACTKQVNYILNTHTVDVFCEFTVQVDRVQVTGALIGYLCEMQIGTGDACPVGTWGAECQFNCTSCTQSSCFSATGVCQYPCASGKHGPRCDLSCPATCAGANCTRLEGDCLECDAGLSGKNCTTVCSPGRYGTSCSKTCARHCGNSECDPFTGKCFSCVHENCSTIKCPSHCEQEECDAKSYNCTSCGKGFYGVTCEKRCSDRCETNECDFTTGACTDCELGYYGDVCDKLCPSECVTAGCDFRTGECESNSTTTAAPDPHSFTVAAAVAADDMSVTTWLIPVIIGCIVLLAVFIFLCRRRPGPTGATAAAAAPAPATAAEQAAE